ncbi:MAG: GntR family transcriptional regulator [Rubritepida sp.]|nr:GntR family transcriptional regulator [Rubritepida sp.]
MLDSMKTRTPPHSSSPALRMAGTAAQSLSATVANLIHADILSGRLLAGDRLKEAHLAEKHAISRATIREALISLEKSGVVERIPGAGARVVAFDRADIEALYEARAGVLALCATACAERIVKSVAQRLTLLVRDMQAVDASNDLSRERHAELAIRAQRLISEGSGNRYLAEFHEQLLNMALSRLVRQQGLAFHEASRRAESSRDWARVARAVDRRNGPAAAAAIHTLMAHSAEAVLSQPIYQDRAPPEE